MSKKFTEPRADPSRTNPSSHPSSHCTDAYTRRAALAQDTSEKSRTHVRNHDAQMYVRGNPPRARFGVVELRTGVMTLRVHAETMPQAGLGQKDIFLPRSAAQRFFKSAAEVVVPDIEENAPVESSAWDIMELRRREPGFTYDVLKWRKVHVNNTATGVANPQQVIRVARIAVLGIVMQKRGVAI